VTPSPSGALSFTWLGHGTFLFRSPAGKRILVDPFLEANPSCPQEFKRGVGELDYKPSADVWILEVQIRHLSREFGAFYEDILT